MSSLASMERTTGTQHKTGTAPNAPGMSLAPGVGLVWASFSRLWKERPIFL